MTLADRFIRLLEQPLGPDRRSESADLHLGAERAAPHLGDAPVEARDAIVVLGARLGAGGAVTEVLQERIDAAAALWHAGAGRIVVASGGVTAGAPRAEADALAEGLAAAGVREVIVERKSLTTADNARCTAAILAPLGAHRVWVVTQPFHARRAARLFRDAGLDPRVWHIANSVQYRDRRRAVRWIAREYLSWGKLLLRGRR